MKIDDLKKLIKDKIGWDEFETAINEESTTVYLEDCYTKEIPIKDLLGVEFENLGNERDYDSMYWRFKVDGVTYQIGGTYDSWSGQERDSIEEFYEVRPIKKTVTVWEAV